MQLQLATVKRKSYMLTKETASDRSSNKFSNPYRCMRQSSTCLGHSMSANLTQFSTFIESSGSASIGVAA